MCRPYYTISMKKIWLTVFKPFKQFYLSSPETPQHKLNFRFGKWLQIEKTCSSAAAAKFTFVNSQLRNVRWTGKGKTSRMEQEMTHLLVKVSLFSKSLTTFSKLVIWSDNRRLRAKSLVAALVHESAEHFGLRSNFHLCCVMLPRYPHRHFFQRILMENYDSTVMHLLKQFLFHTGSLWDGAEPKKVFNNKNFLRHEKMEE